MKVRNWLSICALCLPLIACGGGGGGSSGGTPPAGDPGNPPPVVGRVLTDFTLESLAQAPQAAVPFSFGQVFAPGDLPAGQSLVALQADNSQLALQVDVKATHADGSVRHAVVSGIAPNLQSGESRKLRLAQVTAGAAGGLAPADLVNAGFSAGVRISLAGQIYTATAESLLTDAAVKPWLSGSLVNEWLLTAPLRDAQGNAHPHLTARLAVRWYPAVRSARVDVVVENDWAYEPAPQNFTYDVELSVGGRSVYAQAGLNHFHHARWRKSFWWGSEPQLHLRHNIPYLLATWALPSYDPGIVISEAGLNTLAQRWTAAATSPMGPGIVLPAMPTTGGRPDIGPLPQWNAVYLLSMDRRARTVALGVGDLAGSWPIHYRDKGSDLPVTVVDYPYMTLLGNPGDTINPATKKSEAFPACGGDCSTAPYNYQPDAAHQPSMSYLPYLLTGDYYHLEELHFWANYNILQINPHYRAYDKGLLRSHQVRGQAWSLRTLGQAAYITPDRHPLKAYFNNRLNDNLDWYNATYSSGNPNVFGALDGSGQWGYGSIAYDTPAGASTGLAPWQDDFFTWSVGYLAELGYANAQPLLTWKAKFPVGRMTAPGYCWIDAAVYALAVRPAAGAPLYGSFADAYQATLRGIGANGQPIPLANSTGARYLDQPCGSQAQADWRTQRDKDTGTVRQPWRAGEMDGYANEPAGYPSNMQPALAVAATFALPGASAAWSLFAGRSVKPDFSVEPQWAVIPRTP